MGQIIGGAAKPKRCNLSKLSQLGTPAAGEHILVSSDNSMNAAGQGNFDCYIEGDGRTAATALPLKIIEKSLELIENVIPYTLTTEDEMPVQLTKGKCLWTDGSLKDVANGAVTDYIEVDEGDNLHIAASGNNNYQTYIFFTETKAIKTKSSSKLPNNNNTIVTVPAGAKYIRVSSYYAPFVNVYKKKNNYGGKLIGGEYGLLSDKTYVGYLGVNLSGTDPRFVASELIPMSTGDVFKILVDGAEEQGNQSSFIITDSSKNVISTYKGAYCVPEIFTAPNDGYFRVGAVRIGNGGKISIRIYKYGLKNSGEKKIIGRAINAVGHSFWAREGNVITQFGVKQRFRGIAPRIQECYNANITTYAYDGQSLGATSSSDTSSIVQKMSSWTGTLGDIWLLDTMTNDFKRNIPLGTLDNYNAEEPDALTYYGALRLFRDRVNELSTMPIVVVANATHRNSGGYTSTSANSAGHTLLDYSNALMTICVIEGWYFVDTFSCGITDDNLAETLTDGLHPNNLGFQLIFESWERVLNVIYNKLLGGNKQ